jgi:hypothetical protein
MGKFTDSTKYDRRFTQITKQLHGTIAKNSISSTGNGPTIKFNINRGLNCHHLFVTTQSQKRYGSETVRIALNAITSFGKFAFLVK